MPLGARIHVAEAQTAGAGHGGFEISVRGVSKERLLCWRN